MKVIFLDFDGVLVTMGSWKVRSGKHSTADPATVAQLNRITDATDAQIVVSSTWRLGTEIIELRETLCGWGVTGKVIDKTPYLESRRYQEGKRGNEIQAWLDTTKWDIQSFVILDDDADMEHLMPRLVRTRFDDGLTAELADEAIELLNTPCEVPA